MDRMTIILVLQTRAFRKFVKLWHDARTNFECIPHYKKVELFVTPVLTSVYYICNLISKLRESKNKCSRFSYERKFFDTVASDGMFMFQSAAANIPDSRLSSIVFNLSDF